MRATTRLNLLPESRLYIDLRAAGILRTVAHDPTLSARPPPWAIEVPEGATIDAAVDISFSVADIEPPAELSASDRGKMADNLSGRGVLYAARFPTVPFHGRYVGSLDEGRLSGDLHVRGAPRRIAIAIRGSREGPIVSARGAWQGRLTDLGIKPYAALLGALRLEDWIRLRLQAELAVR